MALRSGVSCNNQGRIVNLILVKMGFRAIGKRITTQEASKSTTCFTSAGVPTSDNETHAPTKLGDLCYDTANSDVYRCTAFVSKDSHTWTKIVD